MTEAPTIQVFSIPGKFPSCNDYIEACRKNPHVGAAMKRKTQKRVLDAIAEYELEPMETPVDVKIIWLEPNRRRDKDNVRFGIKFILDGLVEAGIIKNDRWDDIGNLSDLYYIDKQNPRIHVMLKKSTGTIY